MKNRRERSKRTLSVLLALVLVMTALPTLAWADDGDDGHVHTEDGNSDVSDGELIWRTDPFGVLHIGGRGYIPAFSSADDQPWRNIDKENIVAVMFDYDEQPEIETLEYWFDGFSNLDASSILSHEMCEALGEVMPLSYHDCSIGSCICPDSVQCDWEYYGYEPEDETYHSAGVRCNVCHKSSINSFWLSHTFSGDVCTLCGYSKACAHPSTSRSYTTGCDWEERCNSCGKVVSSGTTHGPYSYSSWSYYSSSQHRRTKSCDYGDWSGYEYASHSTTTSYGQYSSTQHSVRNYCSECGSYVGSTSYSSHSFSYGSWTSYSSTQHRRTKTCSICGYSEYEYKSHSLTYGSWTSTGSSQHKRTVSCSCGYSTTQTEPHDLVTGAWSSVSDTQHRRTVSCSCGYSTTETKSHELTYGSWTQHDATQHKRTKSCSCGYSGTEYAAHTMVPGRWGSVSDTQHSRTNACDCGYTATETASHADSDGDGNCDSCQYLMTRFSVTVPTSLSLGMSQTGQIYAATTAQIVNNSTSAVTVTGVTFEAANGWTLVPYTTNMANAKVNSKCIGFTVNGESSTVTGSTEAKTTAWQIAKGASLPLNYAAVVSATSKAVNEQVLTVVFVVGWAS